MGSALDPGTGGDHALCDQERLRIVGVIVVDGGAGGVC